MADNESSSSKILKFDGKNYPIWKTRMRVYLQALSNDMVSQIKTKCVSPTLDIAAIDITEAKMSPKSKANYTTIKKIASSNNAKALNAIFCAFEDDKTNRISTSQTAYDVWESLRVAYEGDDVVKEQQVQDSSSILGFEKE